MKGESIKAGDVTLDTSEIDTLIRALGEEVQIRIGILGKNSKRRKSQKSNAEIGAKYEFKTEGYDQRSFLRMPLNEHLQKYLEKSGAFTRDAAREIFRKTTLMPWAKGLAVTAERVVLDAFDTGGFGKWKPSIMKYKKNKQTLVETQQLRNSITSEVKIK